MRWLEISGALALANLVAGIPMQQSVECDPLQKYTVDYFSAAKLYEPLSSTCLFYTKVLSRVARDFARNTGGYMSTIWDLYPCDLYNASPTDHLNSLRCIMSDAQEKRAYFSNMSQAMALSCDVSATVMTEDVKKIPMDGIWGGVELPALTGDGRGGRRVDWIEAMDPEGSNAITIWERPERFKELSYNSPPAQQILTSPIEKPTRISKRNVRDQHCPFISAAQMDRWWDDVNW